jgi:hypothetical protein
LSCADKRFTTQRAADQSSTALVEQVDAVQAFRRRQRSGVRDREHGDESMNARRQLPGLRTDRARPRGEVAERIAERGL